MSEQAAASSESGPDSPTAHISTFIQKPEWVPEKFYDAKTGAVDLKNVLKSYGELEKFKGEPKGEQAPAGEPVVPVSDPIVTPAPELPQVPGVNNDAMKAFSAEIQKDGKLSETSYESLVKAGYPKTVVDAYLKGMTSEQSSRRAVQEARIADAEIVSITESIGGKSVLAEMQAWAKASMSEVDLKTYNEAVSSRDASKVRLAVAGLHHTFTQAHGHTPNYLPGGKPDQDRGDGYESSKDITKAINDPRYATSAAYREEVAAKLGRSRI